MVRFFSTNGGPRLLLNGKQPPNYGKRVHTELHVIYNRPDNETHMRQPPHGLRIGEGEHLLDE